MISFPFTLWEQMARFADVRLTQQYDLVGYETVQYYSVTGLAQKPVIAFSLSGQARVFG